MTHGAFKRVCWLLWSSVAKEVIYALSNLASCIVTFSALCVVVEYPRSVHSGEPLEGSLLLYTYFVPIFFLPVYLPLRLIRWLVERRFPLARRLPSMWRVVGAVVGAILLLAFYKTSIFWILVPFLNVHGP